MSWDSPPLAFLGWRQLSAASRVEIQPKLSTAPSDRVGRLFLSCVGSPPSQLQQRGCRGALNLCSAKPCVLEKLTLGQFGGGEASKISTDSQSSMMERKFHNIPSHFSWLLKQLAATFLHLNLGETPTTARLVFVTSSFACAADFQKCCFLCKMALCSLDSGWMKCMNLP